MKKLGTLDFAILYKIDLKITIWQTVTDFILLREYFNISVSVGEGSISQHLKGWKKNFQPSGRTARVQNLFHVL